MQKFCFIKFSSQAPNPNTYSYTLQCLTLTHCAQGGLQGEVGAALGGAAVHLLHRERRRPRAWARDALKSFSFLTRQYFMTSAKGGGWEKGMGGAGEGCLAFSVSQKGAAVGRGNTLAHCRLMPLKNSFISCLLFTTKHSSDLSPPAR